MVVCANCGRETPEGFPRCANCGAELAPAQRLRQERKAVTVLFCDLVGFTSRAEAMDPEDVRALLAPYHAHVRAELERFGGTVEKFIGDAVMAVFGAPVTHEDDPERAVRAALAIRDWAADEGIDLRIGINSGEALVTIGGEPLATGDVVNTAARLQTAAPTGGILTGDATYRATRAALDYDEHEPVAAKGKAEPVRVWLATEARSRVTLERSHGAALVGRDRERALLEDALARAWAERAPQLVTLVGVPGIGKSRLVFELFQHVEALPDFVTWRHGRCLPYGDGVSFWALGEIVKAEAGILETDEPPEVERKLAGAAGDPWVESHLRPLVGLSVEAERGGDRRVEAFAAWRRFFEGLADEHPVVLVFEDLHWADDDLLDFIDHLVEWAADAALLVVCTARPELLERRPGWGGGKPNAITISLSPLSDEETARLIGTLLERPVLAAETQSDLLSRAGGNPLYAEQYASMLRETGRTDVTIPDTVQGIVAARLDLLDPDAKALLQDAAVLGRTFWSGGVGFMGGGDRFDVEEQLHPLERRDFLRRERRSAVAGDTQYTFLHVLVRDVAYGQIPRAARAEKHLRAAEWIESLGRSEDHGELLAHHYTSALELAEAAGVALPEDVAACAARALGEAGDRALALNAFGAAREFYRRALSLTPATDRRRPRLLLRASEVESATWGDEALPAEAAEALRAAGDVEGAAEAELILAALAWTRGDGDVAGSHVEAARKLVADAPASPTKARVLAETVRYAALGGRDEESVAVGQEALAMADRFGLDELRAYTLLYVGSSELTLGDVQGLQAMERSIELLEGLNSPEAARAYNNLASVLMGLGEAGRTLETYRRGHAATERFGDSAVFQWLRFWAVLVTTYIQGDWDDTLRTVEAELERPRSYFHIGALDFRSRIRLARGDLSRAVDDAERAVENAHTAADPQALIPALSAAALVCVGAGLSDQGSARAAEVLAHEATYLPIPHFASPWFDLSWTLVDLGRVDDLTQALARVPHPTRHTEAAEAITRGDYVRAAELYHEGGNAPSEAYTRLRAARSGLADAGLASAIAFFRKAGATAYLAEAEELATGSRAEPARARSTRRAP
jgi:class 3 adenylate cyclase/tetratricopeptide (TPR) repeat protein